MSTTIQLQCIGHLLKVTGKPKLSSGSRETDYIQVIFDESWDGYSKLMVFANRPEEAFRAVIDGFGRAAIPYEVLAQPGRLFMGVYGTKDEQVMTSEFIEYPIYPGAPDQSVDPDPVPSQTVIDQLLQLVNNTSWFNTHANRHASGGLDPLLPTDIGAIPTAQKGAVNGVASLDAVGRVYPSQLYSTPEAVSASRNLTEADGGRMLLCQSNNVVLTIPTGLPEAMELEICRLSNNGVTFQPAEGVTVCSVEGGNAIGHKYGVAVLKRLPAADTWLLSGDLVAVTAPTPGGAGSGIITLTPSQIVDVRRFYKRSQAEDTTTGTSLGTTTTYSLAGNNYNAEVYAIAGEASHATRNDWHGSVLYYNTTYMQYKTLLAFDLSNVHGSIASAVLRLYPVLTDYENNLSEFKLRRNISAWDAATATWASRTGGDTDAGELTLALPVQQWTEVDVTELLSADTDGFGLILYTSHSSNNARYFEKTGDYAPQLVITLAQDGDEP